MGFDEARVRDLVATALEQAIEDGRLTPGARGFRRAQGEIADAALLEPWDADPCRSRLQAIHAERLDRWVKRGSTERDAIIEPVLPLLAVTPAIVDPVAVRAALEPVLWLLDRAASGIALTQTGALNRASFAKWRRAGRAGGRRTCSEHRIARMTLPCSSSCTSSSGNWGSCAGPNVG